MSSIHATYCSCAYHSAFPGTSNSQRIFVIPLHSWPNHTSRLENIVKTCKRDVKVLINKISFSNFWRNSARSEILTQGNVRLDLQQVTETVFNYQIQVGAHTVAAVLVDKAMAEIRERSMQAYAVRKIKSGFQQSLQHSRIYHIHQNPPFPPARR
ncbi:hypothetical protein [Chlamydia avium]|uniref:Uncharacterized protein n=1 Tax=Chlamydia avium 10DC88 TaxID=1229831 RepID=W8JFB3_9CHLA|nr:hypothetical protein [Chlamydia avium]AHK63231.1 hypothetical protein M832_03660 [Chlamydia avium 10DC88]